MVAPATAEEATSQRQSTVLDLLIARTRQQAEGGETTERTDHGGQHDKRDAVLLCDTIENFYHEPIQTESNERSVNESISLDQTGHIRRSPTSCCMANASPNCPTRSFPVYRCRLPGHLYKNAGTRP